MTSLVAAYQDRDVKEAEKILNANKATITADPFIRFFIDDLLRSLRTEYIVDIIKPYTRMNLSFLAEVSFRLSDLNLHLRHLAFRLLKWRIWLFRLSLTVVSKERLTRLRVSSLSTDCESLRLGFCTNPQPRSGKSQIPGTQQDGWRVG